MATNMKVGDLLNAAVGTPTIDISFFHPNKLKPGGNSMVPAQDLRSVPFTQFMGGLASGLWQNDTSLPGYVAVSNLPGNGDTEVYPTGDAIASGAIRNPFTVDGTGAVTIQPSPLTAAELTLLKAMNPPATMPTLLSGAFNTWPFSLTPPFILGMKCILPKDLSNVSGDWPACWAVPQDLQWTAELDVEDGENGAPGSVFLNAGLIGLLNGAMSGSPDESNFKFTPGQSIVVLAVCYPDTTGFYAGPAGGPYVCTGTVATPATMAERAMSPIWNYALKAIAGWPNAEAVTPSLDPMVIQQVYFLAMPAVYPGPGDGVTIPEMTLGSTPSSTGSTSSAPSPTPASTPTPSPSSTTTPSTPAPTPTQSSTSTSASVPTSPPLLSQMLGVVTELTAGITKAQADLAAYTTAIQTAVTEAETTSVTLAGPMFTAAAAALTTVGTDLTEIQTLASSL